jgi:3-oxoacyl-(acyl-carrier-protein) synthase
MSLAFELHPYHHSGEHHAVFQSDSSERDTFDRAFSFEPLNIGDLAMRDNCVDIAGLGICTSIGCDTETFWKNACEGRVGISHLRWADGYELGSRIGGWVNTDKLLSLLPEDENAQRLGRHQLLGIAAASEALGGHQPEALVVGTATGGFCAAEEFYMARRPKLSPTTLHFDDLANEIARVLRLAGPRITISTGCTSSVDAMGYAYWMIRDGRWKSALVVAAEASLTPTTLAAFDVLGAVNSTDNDCPHMASRPFSSDRCGFVLAEGAGAVLLQSSQLSREFQSARFARVVGFGSVSSAYHMTSIEADGRAIRRSIEAALQDTGKATHVRRRIAYINAHGSGTTQNDQAEAAAFSDVFGSRMKCIPVNSTKALVGHSLGAAGIIECVHAALSIANSAVTPAVNVRLPDPTFGLFLPTELLLRQQIPFALKTASGFSGIHSALVLSSCDEE